MSFNPMLSVISPKRPIGPDWEAVKGQAEAAIKRAMATSYPVDIWVHRERRLLVLSALEVVKDPRDIERGPEYHLSVSRLSGRRCSSEEARYALAQFDLSEAEEDNHVPHGFVRNFWRPVNDNLVGLECPCKESEPTIREEKGDFVWRPAP